MKDVSRRGVLDYRLRPSLRRVVMVTCAILLAVVGHTLWDYIEIRRLVHEIENIRAKGEPVSEPAGMQFPVRTKDNEAALYYIAGGTLALQSRPARVPISDWSEPDVDRESVQRVAVHLRQVVQNARDALMLADKAASLSFTAFPAGTEYDYRTAGMVALSQLIAARTVSLSESGDGDAAVESVISGLKLRRALRDAHGISGPGPQVAAVFSFSPPSPLALHRLQAALEAEDRPERPLQDLLRERARYVELVWRTYYGTDPNAPRLHTLPMRSITQIALRPLFTHNFVALLRLWSELIDVARVPWPERAQQSSAILKRYQGGSQVTNSATYFDPLVAPGPTIAAFSRAVDPTPLIIDRCSRAAAGVERFRRDRGRLPRTLSDLVPEYLSKLPIDPFSGRPVLFKADADAYTIYSVGWDLKDDGGHLMRVQRHAQGLMWEHQITQGVDIGVRILVQLAS